jgi:hypothetical protein
MDKSIIIPTFSKGHPPFPCCFFPVETCHFGGCARSGGGSHALGRRGGVLIEIVIGLYRDGVNQQIPWGKPTKRWWKAMEHRSGFPFGT